MMFGEVMCFGLMFNGSHIPLTWKNHFDERIRITWLERPTFYILQGVALTKEVMMQMVEDANDGRRLIHVEKRRGPVTTIYGIYVL